MLGADEFYLTELDGVSTDPAQPPIIRSSQSNSATLSKSTHSSSSTDKKVNFNLEEVCNQILIMMIAEIYTCSMEHCL